MQRHLYHLPTGARAGFFIGDGAGVGKGDDCWIDLGKLETGKA